MAKTVQHPTATIESHDEAIESHQPFDLVSSLKEQVSELIEALIEARMQLDWPVTPTREDILFDLYDEELISKKNVRDMGQIDSSVFFDKLFARRDMRRKMQNAGE